VLLAKALAPTIERGVDAAGAPKAVIGVVIAAIVLLPEGLAALRAARADRLQTSLNLALGSALASIGLTIPAVAMVSLATGWTLVLGLDLKAMVLLVLTLVVATLSLGTGRTIRVDGRSHRWASACWTNGFHGASFYRLWPGSRETIRGGIQ
jgi:Ca2+:H+ antiporter